MTVPLQACDGATAALTVPLQVCDGATARNFDKFFKVQRDGATANDFEKFSKSGLTVPLQGKKGKKKKMCPSVEDKSPSRKA